ncbi:conserved hypothetical protein [groundwater metagenome]|uniref:Uncharacterized protein n=1 Tax=groundwater metagenome TaxID=717931 RepID=A0A098ECT5_9ZZZZ
MSWEEMSHRQYKCPCDAGTYTITSLMDDWNRSEERWEMDCTICKQKYHLYTYHYYDSGMACEAYLWVPRKSYEEMKNVEEHLERTKKEIVDLAHSRYVDKWHSYFDGAKTKKEVWRRLTNNGKKYPSLSTFYSHTKNDDLTKYIRHYFYYDNLAYILEKLGIKDDEINKMILNVKEFEDRLNGIKEQLKKEGYR